MLRDVLYIYCSNVDRVRSRCPRCVSLEGFFPAVAPRDVAPIARRRAQDHCERAGARWRYALLYAEKWRFIGHCMSFAAWRGARWQRVRDLSVDSRGQAKIALRRFRARLRLLLFQITRLHVR